VGGSRLERHFSQLLSISSESVPIYQTDSHAIPDPRLQRRAGRPRGWFGSPTVSLGSWGRAQLGRAQYAIGRSDTPRTWRRPARCNLLGVHLCCPPAFLAWRLRGSEHGRASRSRRCHGDGVRLAERV